MRALLERTMGVRRLLVLAAVGMLVVLTACSSGDAGDDSDNGATTVKIADFTGAGTTVPKRFADEKGYFEKRDIDPEFVQVSDAGTQIAALVAGSLDIAEYTVSQVMAAQQQGQNVKLFCGGVSKQWNVVMVKNDSRIKSVDPTNWKKGFKELEGKTFGLDSLGAGQEAYFRHLADEADVDMDSITLVSVGTVNEASATLKAGRVDAIFGYPFVQQSEVANGNARVAIDLVNSDEQLPYHTGYFATTEWLDDNKDVAKDFCDAITEADNYLHEHSHASKIEKFLTSGVFGLDIDAAKEFVGPDGMTSIYSPILDCDAIDLSAEQAEAAELVEPDPRLRCDDLIWEKGGHD